MAKDDNEAEVALGCILIVIMLPISIFLKGFVLSRLWLWFMVPLGVMPITLAHAYGLAVMIALFTVHQKADAEAKGGGIIYLAFRMNIGGPLIVWFIGWLCYCAM